MNNRGLDELEIAQREIAGAIRSLASGLSPVEASSHAGTLPLVAGPRDGVNGITQRTDLTETLLDSLRRAASPAGGRGEGDLRIGELSVERIAGPGASRIPLLSARDSTGSGAIGGVGAPGSVETSNGETSPTDRVNARLVGEATAVASSFGDAFEPVTRAVRELTTAVGTNTGAISGNTSELGNGLRSVLSGFLQQDKGGGGLLPFLKGGFGVAPLALQIAGLFGKKEQAPEPLSLFDAPASIAIEAANSGGISNQLRRTDRDQFGGIRTEDNASRREPVPAQRPQVIVNVNAMDSQSFMDRSSDIARALRDAMLHMHPVNDVIGEI